MKKYLVFVCAILFAASCGTLDDKDGNIVILSMNRTVDTSMPDSQLCAEFSMSKAELASYFRVAEEVDTATSNAEAIVLPCKYEGKIRVSDTEFFYEVIAGGAGYIYNSDGWVVKNYLCRSESCCSKFKRLC